MTSERQRWSMKTSHEEVPEQIEEEEENWEKPEP